MRWVGGLILVRNVLNSFILYSIDIDTITLANGMYELVPESESGQREAQVNLPEAIEDPNQDSEDPKASYA